jgi:hypothetical protein
MIAALFMAELLFICLSHFSGKFAERIFVFRQFRKNAPGARGEYDGGSVHGFPINPAPKKQK